MEITETDGRIAATDAAGTRLPIRTDGWANAPDAPSVSDALAGRIDGPEEPDAVVTGRTRELRFPGLLTSSVSLTDGDREYLGTAGEHVTLEADAYLVNLDGDIDCYLRFDGSATVRVPHADERVVEFCGTTAVSLGFESSVEQPSARITVPETADGLAAAVSAAAGTPEATTAQRSWPSLRPHPPLLSFGDRTRIPDDLDPTGQSELTAVVPHSVGAVLSVAPLAYYLGARVEPRSSVRPHLQTSDGRIDLGGSFDRTTDRLLRRVFWLDCLVRSGGEYGRPVAATHRLEEIEITPETVASEPVATRLARYREAPVERIEDALPTWALSVTVEPRTEYAPALFRLLHELPFVSRPDGSPTATESTPRELQSGPRRSTEYGSGGTPPTEDHADSDTGSPPVPEGGCVSPVTGRAEHYGWIGERVPVEGFHGIPHGFSNRDRYVAGDGETLTITAVVNDTDGGGRFEQEGDEAVVQYRTRREKLDQDVTVRHDLTVAELGRLIENGVDLLHFVGHHDERGLVCADGGLAGTEIDESRVRTFLLNACGSYPVGRELVERGSVAGGVTFEPVMDETAVRVGTAFAGLIAGGCRVEPAVDLVRRSTLGTTDYTVVGDGTYRLTQHSGDPATVLVDPRGDDYRLLDLRTSLREVGTQSVSTLYDDPHLKRPGTLHRLDTDTLDEFLVHASVPVVFDGEFVRPERLRERL